MQFDVLKSMSALALPVTHYDSRVFPDDSAWYLRFERYVSLANSHRIIGYAQSSGRKDEVLIPLQLVTRSSRFSILESLDNYYSVDYRPICSTPESLELITPLINRLLRRENPDQLCLRALDPDAPETDAILSALKKSNWTIYTSTHQINWVHTLTGDYDHYLATRASRVRNTLRRKTKKLMAIPGVTLTVHRGRDDLELALGAYQEVYERSWKDQEPHPDFVPQLIRATAAKGQLRLGVLRLNDTPIAVHFWVVKQQIGFIYKLAHDRAFDNHSPGTVLLGQMIKYTMKNDKVNRLDFLSGNDSYKSDWMTEQREKIQLRAYNPRSVIAQMARIRDEHIKQRVKQLKLPCIGTSTELANMRDLPLNL